jgi:hypothetical protein
VCRLEGFERRTLLSDQGAHFLHIKHGTSPFG